MCFVQVDGVLLVSINDKHVRYWPVGMIKSAFKVRAAALLPTLVLEASWLRARRLCQNQQG